MIFYQEKDILVRSMEQADAQIICDEEVAQGWHQTVEKYEMRLAHAEKGLCVSLVAEYQGQVAGYINVYREGLSGAFAGRGWPEIVDFGVLEKFRCRGIGSVLMDVAERIAGEYADTVWLGVGVNSGYGSAQRMYAKRGYIPDGSGVWYGDQVADPYENYCNDDDLVLFMSRKLNPAVDSPSHQTISAD